MRSVTATKLRSALFEFLDLVMQGETIVITRNGNEVGRIMPTHTSDWRNRTKIKPKMVGTPEEVFAPLDEIWEKYT